MRENKPCWRGFFLIFCMYILVFQNILQVYLKFFKYFDELLAILVIPTGIIKLISPQNTYKIKKDNLIIVLCLVCLFFSGIISNIIYKYQDVKIYLSDVILVFKFFGVYLFTNWIWKDKLTNKDKVVIRINLKIIIRILFILTIANYIFKLWPSQKRFGIMANSLFYTQPTALAAVCVFLIALLYFLSYEQPKKELLMVSLIMISTLRLKSIGTVTMILVIVLFVFKTKEKITITKLFFLGILLIIVGLDQINYYFIDFNESARNQLLIKSIQIAKDYFPLGTGFATFGSYMSGVSYSLIYSKYGLNHIHGLIEGNTSFISDTFWPMILGQFGVVGLVSYLAVLVLLFKKIQLSFRKDNLFEYVSKLICFFYLLISSTSEAAFVHTFAISLAIVLAL